MDQNTGKSQESSTTPNSLNMGAASVQAEKEEAPIDPPKTETASQSPSLQKTETKSDDPSKFNYASFGKRFLAALLDGLILGTIGFLVKLPFSIMGGTGVMGTLNSTSQTTTSLTTIGSLITGAIDLAYNLYFIGVKGATPGKMALSIKVVKKEDPDKQIGYIGAFLREYVGKIVSSIVLGLGYLWMLWDKDKQTWHDKIAGTVVINTKS